MTPVFYKYMFGQFLYPVPRITTCATTTNIFENYMFKKNEKKSISFSQISLKAIFYSFFILTPYFYVEHSYLFSVASG